MFPFRNLTPEQKKIRLQLQQQLIDRRLKIIETNLKQDEKNVINDLFNDYGITQEQRQAIIAKIDEEKQFEKEYMSRPRKEAASEINIKPEYEHIYQAARIHPQSVKLTKVDDIGALHARARSVTTEPSSNDPKKRTIIFPAEVQLLSSISPSLESPILAHEIGHLASHHNAIVDTLENSLTSITGTTPEQIHNNKNFKEMITIFERQAEILHKNARLAKQMRNYRKLDGYGYYPDQLFLGHYAQLAEIDELHKLKDKLENYKPEPMQPKIDTLSTMKFNAPKQPSQSPRRQFPQKPKVVPVRQNAEAAQQLATE
jgi:hypothetical protein